MISTCLHEFVSSVDTVPFRIRARQAKSVFLKKVKKRQAKPVFLFKILRMSVFVSSNARKIFFF